ncbi:hypothetical protein LV779_12210 [Streptomyces thinghirensis]|nr:hypothetical protein [Streptomyces thinghirensis]
MSAAAAPRGRYGRWLRPARPPVVPASLLAAWPACAFPDSDDLLGEACLPCPAAARPAARYRSSPPRRAQRRDPLGARRTDRARRRPPPGRREEQLRSAARRMLLAGSALATRACGLLRRRQGTSAPPPRSWRTSWSVRPWRAAGAHRVRAGHHGRPSPYASDHAPTPPARPSTTGGPPAAWRFRPRLSLSRSAMSSPRAVAPGPRHGVGRPDRRRPGAGRRVPRGCAAYAEPVEFSPGDLPALREAAARYLRAEPSVPVRITGTVVLQPSRAARRGHRTAQVLAGRGRPARTDHPGRGGLPDRGARPSRRVAGAGARPAGEPGRIPPAHRRLRDRPRAGRRRGRDRLLKAVQEHVEVAAFFEETCGGDGEDDGDAGTDFAVSGPGSVRSPSCVRFGAGAAAPLQSGETGVRRPCDHQRDSSGKNAW